MNYNNYISFDKIYKSLNVMKTDIYEKDNKYVLEIELPGLKKENIIVNYENSYLTIIGLRKTNNNKYVRKERNIGQLKRVFYIGEKKQKDIKAAYNNGILYITFPKEINVKKTSNIFVE